MELLIGISREARLRVIELGKNWNHFLILGCVLLLGGVLAITLPLMTRYDADQVIGWTFLVCGFFQLFQALRVHGSTTFRWWLVFGTLLVLLAIAVLRNPLENFSTVHVVAGLLAGLGLLKIIYAYRLRPAREWSWLLLSGLMSLVLTALLATHLLPADLKLSLLLAVELISAGLCLTLIGWGFNTMNERLIKQVI
ncbi:HdeD family acid-resistance protein [Thiothrix eikelboomii]|uniref:HdeD family acid-resistance protein n=1 Tax=Thiothrix eikelboomii TaxID=92487 RepID=UPI003BB1E1CE